MPNLRSTSNSILENDSNLTAPTPALTVTGMQRVSPALDVPLGEKSGKKKKAVNMAYLAGLLMSFNNNADVRTR